MDVLIVGAGAVGRWFGSTVDASTAFADVDADAARTAADATGGRSVALDGDESFDAVCLAVPMNRVVSGIETHASRAKRAVLDVSGVMEPPLEAMGIHAPDRERISLHPLFAPERAPGSIAVVEGRAGPVTGSILADLETRGNRLVETTAAEHDAAMESVQAAAHAAVLSFALAAEEVPSGFATPVYDDLRRLARQVTAGNPRVYGDIQRTFPGADAVAEAATRIADADGEDLEALYREAGATWHDGGEAG